MFVELSEEAQKDLEAIKRYIAFEGHTPNRDAAQQTVSKVLKAIEVLETYPHFGKPGRVSGTFELHISSAPYFAVYRFIGSEKIVVTAIFHDRRQYPG